MPLRGHFRPPVRSHHSWEGFHVTWPVMVVQHLDPALSAEYPAQPRVPLGQSFELDISRLVGDDGTGRQDTATPTCWN
jgi:hypothetical protein